MIRYSMIALAVLLVPLTGTAVAGGGVDESLITLDLRPVGGNILYLAKDFSMWEELNGAGGLQTAKTAYGGGLSKDPDARFSGP